MAKQYILKRDVTPEECPWLDKTMAKGEMVYAYSGNTYKLIGKNGVAFTLAPDAVPFFELPVDAVKFYAQIDDKDIPDMWLITRDEM